MTIPENCSKRKRTTNDCNRLPTSLMGNHAIHVQPAGADQVKARKLRRSDSCQTGLSETISIVSEMPARMAF